MKKVSEKVVEIIKILSYFQFFFKSSFLGIMSKTTVESGRPQVTNGACTLDADCLWLKTHTVRTGNS